ncbi:MAG: hypothetical protein ACE5KQ_02145 [Thermoplasmata archaeon]
MRGNRVWLLVVAVLASALFGGLVTQEAAAQTYSVEVTTLQRTFVEFGLGRTLEMGQDILVLVDLTVVLPRNATDTVRVTVISPDAGVGSNSLNLTLPTTVPTGARFTFVVQQVTFVPGDFTVVVTSTLDGQIGPILTFPTPNYDVTVGVSTMTGQVGTQFIVTTTVDVGAMSEIRTRLDIDYVLDGVPLRQSHMVILFGETQGIINEDLSFILFSLPRTPDQMTWVTTQGFTLSPGNHTLTVEVVDRSINHVVASETFSIQVTDQIGDIETRVDEVALELGGQIDDLSGQVEDANRRAASAEAATATASALAIVAFAALGLSVVALLLQLGMLKLSWFRRRRPGEPEE